MAINITGEQGGGSPRRDPSRQYTALSAPVLVPLVSMLLVPPVFPDWIQREFRQQPSGSVSPLVPIAPPVDVQTGTTGQDSGVLIRRVIQYPSVTGPVLTPTGAETITVDKWHPTYPDRPNRSYRVPEGFTVGPVFVPDVTHPVTPLSWSAEYADRALRAQPRIPSQAVAPLFVPDVTNPVTALSWAAEYPDRVLRGRAIPPLATVQNVLPIPPSGETITIDKWLSRYPDRTRAPYRVNGLDGIQTSIIEDAPIFRLAIHVDRVDRRGLHASQHQAFAWNTTTPPPPVDVETGTTGQDSGVLTRRLIQYPSVTGPILIPPPPSAPAFAPPVYPSFIFRPYKRATYTNSQPMFGVEVGIPVEAWTGSYPDRVERRPSRQPSVLVGPLVPIAPPPDVETGSTGQDSGVLTRRLIQYPALTGPILIPPPPPLPTFVPPTYPAQVVRPSRLAVYVNAQPEFGVEVGIPVESWIGSYPARVASSVKRITVTSVVAPLVTPAPIVAPDHWFPIYPDRVLRRRPVVYPLPSAPVFVADVTVIVPRLSWQPRYPDFARKSRLTAPNYGEAATYYVIQPPLFNPAWAVNSNHMIALPSAEPD